MADEYGSRWVTVAEQRHVILEKRRDFQGEGYVLTACGWLGSSGRPGTTPA